MLNKLIHIDSLYFLSDLHVILQGCLFSISNVLIQSSVNSFGASCVAGNTAASNVEGIIYTAMNSFYQSAISFVGQNYGAGKIDRVKKGYYLSAAAIKPKLPLHSIS